MLGVGDGGLVLGDGGTLQIVVKREEGRANFDGGALAHG